MKTNKKIRENKRIKNTPMILLTYLFVALFLGLMSYLVYFQLCISEDVINSPYNRKRQDIMAEKVVRGKIFSSDGKILAETITNEDQSETRNYPYGKVFAHVVGYSTKGGSGLESYNNIRLLRSNILFTERITNNIQEKKNLGDNVITTLDTHLQETAYKALGSHDGAVIVMEPNTGRILAMVSKPDYDPNEIESIWNSVTDEKSKESMLLNRATQGLYPPGSTFKIFTALDYVRENSDYNSYNYICKGSHTYDDNTINCYHKTVHGELDLKESFAKSCNSSFVNIGISLNRNKLQKLCDDFYFNQDISIGIETKSSRFSLTDATSNYKLMQTVIGQGDTLVTPLQMAMAVATIENGGMMMQPYLLDHTESVNGSVIRSFHNSKLASPITEEEAATLREYMLEAVQSGTATSLKGRSYTVGGKTGSAEFGTEKGNSHAWFVGFAEKNDKPIVVSIIVEAAGTGSEFAVPIAEKVFDAYYD